MTGTWVISSTSPGFWRAFLCEYLGARTTPDADDSLAPVSATPLSSVVFPLPEAPLKMITRGFKSRSYSSTRYVLDEFSKPLEQLPVSEIDKQQIVSERRAVSTRFLALLYPLTQLVNAD
jgi:hypothetical protein